MITVLRHGRTAVNAAGLLLGRSDPPLDDTGRHQAEAVGRALGRVDLVVSSPLRRAQETAAALDAPRREVDDRVIELDYGEWEGRPVAEVTAEEWRRWRHDLWWAPPGGESLGELGRRVRGALEELSAVARDSHVVVVTHVSPLKAAVAWALGVGDEITWRIHVAPASRAHIELGGGGPRLTALGLVPSLSPP